MTQFFVKQKSFCFSHGRFLDGIHIEESLPMCFLGTDVGLSMGSWIVVQIRIVVSGVAPCLTGRKLMAKMIVLCMDLCNNEGRFMSFLSRVSKVFAYCLAKREKDDPYL